MYSAVQRDTCRSKYSGKILIKGWVQRQQNISLCFFAWTFFIAKISLYLPKQMERSHYMEKKKMFLTLINVENNRKLVERVVTFPLPFTKEFVASLATEDGQRVTEEMIRGMDKKQLLEDAIRKAEEEAGIFVNVGASSQWMKIDSTDALMALKEFSRKPKMSFRIYGGKSGAAVMLSKKILRTIEKILGKFTIVPDSIDSFSICLSTDKELLNAGLRDSNQADEEEKLSDYCFVCNDGILSQLA